MTTPTFLQWKTNSQAAPGLPPQQVKERILSAFATLVSNQNPDGTVKGS